MTGIAALAFELFPEAVDVGGLGPSVVGLFSGAGVFVAVNTLRDSRVGAVTMRSEDRSQRFVVGIWTVTAVVLTVVVGSGR